MPLTTATEKKLGLGATSKHQTSMFELRTWALYGKMRLYREFSQLNSRLFCEKRTHTSGQAPKQSPLGSLTFKPIANGSAFARMITLIPLMVGKKLFH